MPSKYIDDHPQLGKTIQLIPDGLANGATGDFFASACSAFGRSNQRWFCDPQLERTIRAAITLEARNHRAAGIRWARIDREFVDRAAWVPMVNVRWVDFVSAHVHDYRRTRPWASSPTRLLCGRDRSHEVPRAVASSELR